MNFIIIYIQFDSGGRAQHLKRNDFICVKICNKMLKIVKIS